MTQARGSTMTARISRDVLEGYLNCKYKGHLKLAEEHGVPCEYEGLLAGRRDDVRLRATEKLLADNQGDGLARQLPLTVAALQSGPALALDVLREDETYSLHFDGLKRAEGSSKLGGVH